MIAVMIAILKRSDPRILIFALITIIAVLFSIYKAADSLSGTETIPEYRNRPPEAFAQPLPVTLVDSNQLTEERLSDQGYQFAISNSQKISELIVDKKVGPQVLSRAGMDPEQIQATLRSLQGQYRAFSDRQATTEGPPQLIDSGVDTAELSQPAEYQGLPSGAPGGQLTIYYLFEAGERTPWKLSRLDIEVD
jgi:hypothetical protein